MTAKSDDTHRKRSVLTRSNLRRQAEAALRNSLEGNENLASPPPKDWQSLLHELHVHQIELEMQNEELRQAQAESESARDRYIELYDLAPVGYLTLRQPGIILAANLTAAQMLEVPRAQLIGSPLRRFVFREDQDAYYHYLKALFGPEARGILEVRLVKSDDSQFDARLEASTRDKEDLVQLVISNISDLKRAEQALKEANATLEMRLAEQLRVQSQLRLQSAALEAAANGIIITERQGDIRWANPAFTRMSGYSLEEVLGKNPRLLSSGLHDSDFYSKLWEAILAGQVWHGEMINRRKDSSLYFEEQIITPLRDENGEIAYFIAIKQDITERKRAEQSLRESEALFRTVFENLPVGVWLADSQGNITYGNPAGQQIWAGARYVGMEQFGEYKGWWVSTGKRVEPDEWAVARAIKNGETSLNEELEIECFDGTHKFILNSAIPILDDRQQVNGAFIVNQDITRRKRAEEELRRANAYNRSLIEASLDPLVMINIDGKITDVNSATEKVTGCSRQELIGADFSDYFTEPQRARAGYQQVFLDGSVHDFALEIRHKHGHITPVLYNATVYSDEAGKVIGVFAAARDITERKRYEKELIQSKELIETAFNSIDTHIAYMDRDFNFIRVNDAYARAAGHPADFFIGKNHFDLYPHEENQAIFQRVVETGAPFSVFEKSFEYAEYPERGVTCWDWSLQPVKRADNTIEGVVLSLVDVTERKRAEIQLERQNKELRDLSSAEHKQRELAEGLAQSVIALNSNLDLEYVLDTILEQLRRAIPYTIAAVTQIDDGSASVARYTSLEGHPEAAGAIEFNNLLMNYPLQKEIIATLQPVYIEDVAEYPNWNPVPGVEWIRSYIAAPLVVGGRYIGTIHLTSDQPGAFGRETATRLMAFAAPAALAIRNARLYAAESHARQVAEALSAAVQALTQTLDLDRVLDALLEHVGTISQSDTTGIALLEGETRMAARAALGYERWINLAQVLSISMDAHLNPVLQTLISTRKSVLVPDATTFPGWQDIPGLEAIRNWLVVPLVANDKVIGVVGLGKIEPGYFTQQHIQLVEALVAQAAMAIQNAWLFEQVRAGHERLQSLSRRLVEVQESERRYIARELHDETSQALTALKFGLRFLEQEVDHPENLLARLAELKQLTDGVLEDLHRLAMDLRPASLDHLGLVAALEQLVKVVSERYNIRIRFKTVGISEEIRLPDELETTLYRIVQEALTNAVRHAKANNVDVILEQRDRISIVVVEDDGVGFNTNEIQKSGHLGLLGMQERAQMAGGTLQVESRPGGGTTIVAEVPYVDTYRDR